MHHSVIALSGILSPSAPQLLFLLSPKRHLENNNAAVRGLNTKTERINKEQNTIDATNEMETTSSVEDNKNKLQGIHTESSSSSSSSSVAEADDNTTILYQINRTPREMLSLLLARSLQSLCSSSGQCSADLDNNNVSTSLISPIKCHYYLQDTANSENALGDDSSGATSCKKNSLFSYRRWGNKGKEARQMLKIEMSNNKDTRHDTKANDKENNIKKVKSSKKKRKVEQEEVKQTLPFEFALRLFAQSASALIHHPELFNLSIIQIFSLIHLNINFTNDNNKTNSNTGNNSLPDYSMLNGNILMPLINRANSSVVAQGKNLQLHYLAHELQSSFIQLFLIWLEEKGYNEKTMESSSNKENILLTKNVSEFVHDVFDSLRVSCCANGGQLHLHETRLQDKVNNTRNTTGESVNKHVTCEMKEKPQEHIIPVDKAYCTNHILSATKETKNAKDRKEKEEITRKGKETKPVHTLASIIELSALQLFLLQSLIAYYNNNNNSNSSTDMEMELGGTRSHTTNHFTLQLILAMWREINEQVFTFQVKSIVNPNHNLCPVQERVIPHGVSGVITYALKQARTLPENRMTYNTFYTNHDIEVNSANQYMTHDHESEFYYNSGDSTSSNNNTSNFHVKLARAYRLRTSIRALLHMYISLTECRELCVRHSFTHSLIYKSLATCNSPQEEISINDKDDKDGNNQVSPVHKPKNKKHENNKSKREKNELQVESELEKEHKVNNELINWLQPFLTFVEMLQRSWVHDAERSIMEENTTVAIWWLQLLPCMMQMYMHVMRWRVQYIVYSELEQKTTNNMCTNNKNEGICNETNNTNTSTEELLEALHSKLSWLLCRMLHYNPEMNELHLQTSHSQEINNKNGELKFNDACQMSSMSNHNNNIGKGDANLNINNNNNSGSESRNVNALTSKNDNNGGGNNKSIEESDNVELIESSDALHRSRGKRSLFYHDKSANHIILNDSNNINGSSNNNNNDELEIMDREGRRAGFANRFTLRHAREEDHINRNDGKVGRSDRERRKNNKKKQLERELMLLTEQGHNGQRQHTKGSLLGLMESECNDVDDNALCSVFFSKFIQSNVHYNATHSNHCKSNEELEQSNNTNHMQLHNNTMNSRNNSSSNKISSAFIEGKDEVMKELVNHFSLWKFKRETLMEENWLSMLLSYSNVMKVLYETYTPSEKSHLMLPDANYRLEQEIKRRRIVIGSNQELQGQSYKKYEVHKKTHNKGKAAIAENKRSNFHKQQRSKENFNVNDENSSNDTLYAMKMLELSQDGERSWQKWICEILCENARITQNKHKLTEINKLIQQICNHDKIKCRLLQLLAHARELLPLHVLHHATHLIRLTGSVIAQIDSISGRSSNISSLLPQTHSTVPSLSGITQETDHNNNYSTYSTSGKAYREPQQLLKEENLHTALLIGTELELQLYTSALHNNSNSSSCITRRNIIIDSIYNGFMYKLEEIKQPTLVHVRNNINSINSYNTVSSEKILTIFQSLHIANYWELELQNCVSDALENPERILCNMRNACYYLQKSQNNDGTFVRFDKKSLLQEKCKKENKMVCPLFTTQLACMFLLRNIDCLLLQFRHSSCISQRVNKWVFENKMKGDTTNSNPFVEHFSSTCESSIYECAHMYEFVLGIWSTNTKLLLANCTPYVLNKIGSLHKRLSADLLQLQRNKHANNCSDDNSIPQTMMNKLTNMFMDFVLCKLFPHLFVHLLNGIKQFAEMNSTSAGIMSMFTYLRNNSTNTNNEKYTHINLIYTDNVEYSITFFQRLFLLCLSITATQVQLNSIALEELFNTSPSSSSSSSSRMMNDKKMRMEQLRKAWSEVVFRFSMYVLQHIQKYSNANNNSNNTNYNSDSCLDISSDVDLTELEQLVHKALNLAKKKNHSTSTLGKEYVEHSSTNSGELIYGNDTVQLNDFLWILEMDDAREMSLLTRYRSITQLEPLPFHVMMERLRQVSEPHLHVGYEPYLIAARRKKQSRINETNNSKEENELEVYENEKLTTNKNSTKKANHGNKSSRSVIISFQEENNAIYSALALLRYPASLSSSFANNDSLLSYNNYNKNNGEGMEISNTVITRPHLLTLNAFTSTMPSFSPFAFVQQFNYHDLFACSHFIRFMIKENQALNASLPGEREDITLEVSSTREGNSSSSNKTVNTQVHDSSKGANYLCDMKTSLSSKSNIQRNARELNDCLVLLRICKMLHSSGGWGLLNMALSLSSNIGRVMKRQKRELHRTEFSSDLAVTISTTTTTTQTKSKETQSNSNEVVEGNATIPSTYMHNNSTIINNNENNKNNMLWAQVNVSEANYEMVRELIVQSVCVHANHISLPIPGQPLDYTFMWKVAIAFGELLSPVGLHLLNCTREGALVAWAAPHSSQMQLNTKMGNSHYESFIYGFRQLLLHLHEGSSQFCTHAHSSSSPSSSSSPYTTFVIDELDDINDPEINSAKCAHLEDDKTIINHMPRYYREIWTNSTTNERNAEHANEDAAKEFARFLLTLNCTFHGICEFVYYHVLSASEQHHSETNKRMTTTSNTKTGVNVMFNQEWTALLRMMLQTLLNQLIQCINSYLTVQKINIYTQINKNIFEKGNQHSEMMFINEYAVLLWSSMSALSLLERLRGAINHSCNSNSYSDNVNNSYSGKISVVNRESSVYHKTSDSKQDTSSGYTVNSFVSTVAEREQWERVVSAFTNKAHDLVDLYSKMITNTQEECSFITIMQRGLELIEMSMFNSRRSTSYSVGLPFCLRNDISSVLITLHHLMENVLTSSSLSSSEAYQHEHKSELDSVNNNNNNIIRTHALESDKYTACDVFYTVWSYIAQELIVKQTSRIAFDLPVSSDNEVKEEKGKKGKKRNKKIKKNASINNSGNDEKESKVTTDEAHNTTLQTTPIKVPHLYEFKVIVSKIVNLPIIADESTKREYALEDKHTEEEEGKDKLKKQKTVLKESKEKAEENTKMSDVEQLSSHIVEDAHAAFTPLLVCSKENQVQLLKKFRADDINNDEDDADDVNTDDEGDNEIDLKGSNNKSKSNTRLRSGRHVYNYELYHQSFSVEEALNEKVLSLHEMVEHLTTQGIMLKRRVIDVVRSASLTKNNTKMKGEQEWESHELTSEKRQSEEYKMGLESNKQTSFQSVSWALASSSPTIVAQIRVLYKLHLHNMIVLLENFTLSELVAEPKSAMLFGTLRTFKEKFPQLFTTEGVNHYNQDQQQQEQQTVTNHLQRLWQLLTSKFREEYILPNQKLFVESCQELCLCKDISILEKRNVSKSKRRREKLKRWKDLYCFTGTSESMFGHQGQEAKRRVEQWYLSMVNLHNPSLNTTHQLANFRPLIANSTPVHDTQINYKNKNNYNSELLFWHDHLHYYPFYRTDRHKDKTTENNRSNNDDYEYNNNDENNSNVNNLKPLRYYTSSQWHWKPLLSRTNETPVLFPLHVMLSLLRTLDGLSAVRPENLLYGPFLFVELLLEHGVEHFVAVRPRVDGSAINVIPFILRSWQLQTSSTSIISSRKGSQVSKNKSRTIIENDEEEEEMVEENNANRSKSVMVVVDKESVLKKYSPNVHYALGVRNTFFTSHERERLQREFEPLTTSSSSSSSSSLSASSQAGQEPQCMEELTFDYVRYGLFYVEVVTQLICSYSEYVNKLKRDMNLQRALTSALSSISFASTREFAANDVCNTTKNNYNTDNMENERSKESNKYKINNNNLKPLAWARELTTLASNRNTHDSTYGNYSNYNKKMNNDIISNYNNVTTNRNKWKEGEDYDNVVEQLLYSQLYNVISVLTHHCDSLSHLALDKTALFEWEVWKHKYELVKKLTLNSDDAVITKEEEGKNNDDLSAKANYYSDQVQYERQRQCEHNFRYVNEIRHMVSSGIQSTLTKLEQSKWEDTTPIRLDTPYAMMPLLSQLTCLLLLQTSCVTLTHFNLSVNNQNDKSDSVNVNQDILNKGKRYKQKKKQHKLIMRNNSKMLKMTKNIDDTVETNDDDDNMEKKRSMEKEYDDYDDNKIENLNENELNSPVKVNAELDKARVRIYSSVAHHYPHLSIATPTLVQVFTPVFLMNTIAPKAHTLHDAEINTLIGILSYYVTVHTRFSTMEFTSPSVLNELPLHHTSDTYFSSPTNGFHSRSDNNKQYLSSSTGYEPMTHPLHSSSLYRLNMLNSHEYRIEEQMFITAMMSIIATIIGNTDIRTMALKMFCEKFVKYIIRMFTEKNSTSSDGVRSNTDNKSNTSFLSQNQNDSVVSRFINGNPDTITTETNSRTRGNHDEMSSNSALQQPENVLQHVPHEVLITFLASMSRKDVSLHKKSLGALLYYAMHSRLYLFGHPPLDTRQGKLSLVRVNSAQTTNTLLNTSNPLYTSTINNNNHISHNKPSFSIGSTNEVSGKEMIGKKLTLRNPSVPQLTICTPVPDEANDHKNNSINDKENANKEDKTENQDNKESESEIDEKKKSELAEEDMQHQLQCLSSFQLSSHTTSNDLYDGNHMESNNGNGSTFAMSNNSNNDEDNKAMMASHRLTLTNLHLPITTILEIITHYIALRKLSHEELTYAVRMLRAADEARRERVSQYNSLLQVVAAQKDEEETTQLRQKAQLGEKSEHTTNSHIINNTISSTTSSGLPSIAHSNTSTFAFSDGLKGLNASLELADPTDYGIAILHLKFALQKIIHASIRNLVTSANSKVNTELLAELMEILCVLEAPKKTFKHDHTTINNKNDDINDNTKSLESQKSTNQNNMNADDNSSNSDVTNVDKSKSFPLVPLRSSINSSRINNKKSKTNSLTMMMTSMVHATSKLDSMTQGTLRVLLSCAITHAQEIGYNKYGELCHYPPSLVTTCTETSKENSGEESQMGKKELIEQKDKAQGEQKQNIKPVYTLEPLLHSHVDVINGKNVELSSHTGSDAATSKEVKIKCAMEAEAAISLGSTSPFLSFAEKNSIRLAIHRIKRNVKWRDKYYTHAREYWKKNVSSSSTH